MRKTSVFNRDGFTLLEVLVSLAIMAFVLIAVFRMHAQSVSMQSAGRFYTTAPLLLQAKLSEFITTPLEELASDSGDFGENYPGYTWQFRLEDVDSEALGAVAAYMKNPFTSPHRRRPARRYHSFQGRTGLDAEIRTPLTRGNESNGNDRRRYT